MAIDEVEVGGSQGQTFKDLIMMQFMKTTFFCNVEFRGGYYTITTTKTGEEKELYVPDSRDVFGNATIVLGILLQARFTEEMKDNWVSIGEELEGLTKWFIDKSSVDEEVILGDSFYTIQQDKILLDEYKNKRLVVHLRLFTFLCEEYKKRGYGEIQGESFE